MKSVEAEAKSQFKFTPDPRFVKDTQDIPATLKVIQDAIDSNPGHRRLVHLLDVQISVKGDLPKNRKKDILTAAEIKDVILVNNNSIGYYRGDS